MEFVFSTRFIAGFLTALALGIFLHNVRAFPYRVTAANGG